MLKLNETLYTFKQHSKSMGKGHSTEVEFMLLTQLP